MGQCIHRSNAAQKHGHLRKILLKDHPKCNQSYVVYTEQIYKEKSKQILCQILINFTFNDRNYWYPKTKTFEHTFNIYVKC